MMKNLLKITLILLSNVTFSQFNFNYNFNTTGRRVCLVESVVNTSVPIVTISFLENYTNISEPYTVKRRIINGTNADWNTVATNIPATTLNWADTNVSIGQAYEYQVRRTVVGGDAIGYLTVAVNYDQSNYKGKMILAIDISFQNSLSNELLQLKNDLTNEGWNVIELYVPRATTWETEASIITTKNAIATAYNNAPTNDKPTHLFLLGHIPIARSGQNAIAPDNHNVNKGARGSDCFYADIDGVFTDVATYNPFNINSLAINLPGDLKWDQDFIPSSLEMAFGRVDFADITSFTISEENLLRSYLNRLHQYRIVANGFDMGEKTAFRFGYDNSNDGSYRSLIPISGSNNVDYYSNSLLFPQWVQENGPYQIFMQNSQVPNLNEWTTYGMDATIFSSDQSYWGYWDEPEGFVFSKIRALLASNTKCLGIIYTTTAINTFHQPAMGETMGWSSKRIMDHNNSNNLLEKRQQSYDTAEFWNRTHFQYHGDPTLRLFQVKPASNLQATTDGSSINLTWNASPDDAIIGYHIYKSASEFGVYTKLTTTPISILTYTDTNFLPTDWYMVRAIKLQTTGSGSYLNPSIGIRNNANQLSTLDHNLVSITVYPNPTHNEIFIESSETLINYQVLDLQGNLIMKNALEKSKVDLSELENGVYFLKLTTTKGTIIKKLIKT